MPVKIALILLAVAGVASGQISPEEAQRRLEERRAAAATRPVDASIISELKLQVATLQREVTRLKAENDSLVKRLADAQAQATAAATATATTQPAQDGGTGAQQQTAPPAVAAVKPTGKLRLGMSLEEANAAMGFEGKLVGEGHGWQQYEWQLAKPARPGSGSGSGAGAGAGDEPRGRTILGDTAAPAGPSIFARFEGGSLTSYAKR